jgi:hypothetical protein
MMMSAAALILKYGQTVGFKKDGDSESENIKAFVQPLRYEDWMNLQGYYTGSNVTFNNDFYLYIGLPSVRIDNFTEDGVIVFDEKNLIIKDTEKICVGDKILYIKAILQNVRLE